jgi:cobalt/nickel transport system ATP-binding protein
MLKTENLTVRYNSADTSPALNGVSLTVREGERIALAGANGAGKSTLLLSLIGVLTPESGTVWVEDARMEKKTLRELRGKVGMVFQNPDDQLFMPTVYDDIAFGPRNYGMGEQDIGNRADSVLEKLGIAHLKGRMAHKLSGGEKRLAALAGVLVMEPSVLLMDEPSAFLDPRARRRLIEILQALTQTMVVATHDLDMALDLCDRAILLKEGGIYADGPAEAVLCDAALLEVCGLELPLSVRGRGSGG